MEQLSETSKLYSADKSSVVLNPGKFSELLRELRGQFCVTGMLQSKDRPQVLVPLPVACS